MGKILVPTTGAEDWKRLLREPERGWRRGAALRALAHCWEESQALPEAVRTAFAGVREFEDLEVLLAIPRHPVPLPGGYFPAESDLWVLARSKHTLVSVAVKAVSREPLGETLGEWRDDAVPGKQRRLEFLRTILDLEAALPDDIPYPLLKWTASAVMEAVRFHARHAVMLVHSFTDGQAWFSDFLRFAALFGTRAVSGALAPAGERMGVTLHLGWVKGSEEFLAR